MALLFHISYSCASGSRLRLIVTADDGTQQTHTMRTTDGTQWTVRLANETFPPNAGYHYEVVDAVGVPMRVEQGLRRTLPALHGDETCVLSDAWKERREEPALLRAPFSRVLFKRARVSNAPEPYRVRFYALPAPPRSHWALAGSTEALGAWDVERAVTLRRVGTYVYEATLSEAEFSGAAEYKYILRDDSDKSRATWEQGANRVLQKPPFEQFDAVCRNDFEGSMERALWRGAGVVVPVASLRSEGSQGIGDFGDLNALVGWAASAGMHAVQLLPVNDTTATFTARDSYPYSSISVFALHPIYIDLRPWTSLLSADPSFAADAGRLNALPEIDYEGALRLKLRALRVIFKAEAEATMRTRGFRTFERSNRSWLRPYAFFCALRDRFGTSNFRDWEGFAAYSPEKLETLAVSVKEVGSTVRFYAFVQYLLHGQLVAVHRFAASKRVILKGDIPIGISRCSVPAWVDGRLFRFEGSAGAPPDAFARQGQNWGFPTYRWEAMERDGYAWWRRRFDHMSAYFDAYRIDHVLGFFRIWEIPTSQRDGVLGHFRPALPLSAEEIRAGGIACDVAELCIASLSREDAEQRFSRAELHEYMQERGGRFYLRPGFTSQRAIAETVPDESLRERLSAVCTEVLFIEDAERRATYHPRILGQETQRYKQLPPHEREAFDRLAEDFFYRRHDAHWAAEALRKLPALTQDVPAANGAGTRMLPCAEDLGMMAPSVSGVLRDLHILSLEIERMPKAYGAEYDNPAHYPYLSVAAPGTHDMPTLRMWWRESRKQVCSYWNGALRCTGEAPEEADEQVCEAIIQRHLASPAMLCLPALQDWLAISPELRREDADAEQINVPSDPAHNWSYRLHITLETLSRNTAFSEKIRGLIERNKR